MQRALFLCTVETVEFKSWVVATLSKKKSSTQDKRQPINRSQCADYIPRHNRANDNRDDQKETFLR